MKQYDIAIVGGGPAGVSHGAFSAKNTYQLEKNCFDKKRT